jgi:hypothetical protein
MRGNRIRDGLTGEGMILSVIHIKMNGITARISGTICSTFGILPPA